MNGGNILTDKYKMIQSRVDGAGIVITFDNMEKERKDESWKPHIIIKAELMIII